ncbi:MAG: NAD(P)H-hydrate dehydratase [Elusimicrobiota bacterium]
MKIISAKEMARLDEECGVETDVLMEQAGAGMAAVIEKYLPDHPVCFICGNGNNGGDGFVAARYLYQNGRDVEVYTLDPPDKLKELPGKQAEKTGLPVTQLPKDRLKYILNSDKIVVDCIFGTGFRPPLENNLKDILDIINKKSKITVACDIPTGVNGNTGEADPGSIQADLTVTFAYPKTGHIRGDGSLFTGTLEVVDIGIDLSPEEYLDKEEFVLRQDCEAYFTRRKKDTHKKTYGHILVVGGSPGMSGAVTMSALGALRTGAGPVTSAVSRDIAARVAAGSMSSMTLELDTPAGYLAVENAADILSFIEKRSIDCVILGPGMSTGQGQAELVKELLGKIECPVVLDADGLNNVAGDPGILKNRRYPLLLTPHPGEMARITGKSGNEIAADRVKAAVYLANETGSVVLLKGFRSVITDGSQFFINSTGNPGMATGGSGDILSGMAAALIGQEMNLLESAKTAAWVHGRGGDIAAWAYGERYILPEDILKGIVLV